jgi:hypothetical protein
MALAVAVARAGVRVAMSFRSMADTPRLTDRGLLNLCNPADSDLGNGRIAQGEAVMEWFRLRFTSTLVGGEPIEGTIDVIAGSMEEACSSYTTWRAIRAQHPRIDVMQAMELFPVGPVEDGDPAAGRVDDDPRYDDAGATAGFQIRVIKTDTITT